jgi:hypothetical protein
MQVQPDNTQPPPQTLQALAAQTCTCERPLPRVLAERKWAARTYCDRCGLPLRLAFR